MCVYISRNALKPKKNQFLTWIGKVQTDIKKKHHIHFSYRPIGSGKRNMVVQLCNSEYYDLDYQIEITKIPSNMNFDKDAKEIKNIFKDTFDNYKPSEFSNCEDSTQALTVKNTSKGYGYDIIITTFKNGSFYILYNKKNTNNANNNDYCWEIRADMKKFRENLKKIKGADKWDHLRKIYLEKRHSHKDDKKPDKKKAYQLLNEAVNETISFFGLK